MLSIVLTASVLFPNITSNQILGILGVGTALSLVGGVVALIKAPKVQKIEVLSSAEKMKWRMAPVSEMKGPVISPSRRIWLLTMRGYLIVASLMVVIKVVELARGH